MEKKQFVLLSNGFKLNGSDVHLKVFGDLAKWASQFANVCICAANYPPNIANFNITKQEMEHCMRSELESYYKESMHYIQFKVLSDYNKINIDWRSAFINIYEFFGKIDVLFVSSGFWRPHLVEKLFIKLSKKSYLYKMGLHNTIENIESFTGLLSPRPETEILPANFKGDVLLRPAASGIIGPTTQPLDALTQEEQWTVDSIRRLNKSKILITFTNNLTGRLEPKYYWIIRNIYKHYKNDVAVILVGKDSINGKLMIHQNCGDDISILTLPYQNDLTRFCKLVSQNFECIYIHPDHSGGGYCKVLAAFFMPTFVFSNTDSVQMHPESMCSCKEEKLFKCINAFDNYHEAKKLIQLNLDYEKHFRNYSKWLLEFLITKS